MHRFLIPLALAAAGVPACALAAPAETPATPATPAALTLDQALRLALRANPQLAAAGHELQASAGAVEQAGLRPNPILSVELQDNRRATRESTLQLSQTLELGGKRAARTALAGKAQALAALSLQTKRREIRCEVTKAFYGALIAAERLNLAQQSLANAQRATLSASRRVLAGKISPVDEDKARVAEAGIALELLQAQSELATARLRLAAFWGGRAADFSQLAGTLEAMPALPELAELSARLDASPAMQAARAEVERSEAAAAVERSRRLGDVAVSVGVKRSEELGRSQALVGLSVPLPLFDRNQGALLESLRRIERARDEAIGAATALHTELAEAHARFTLARQQVAAIRGDILPRAGGAFDAANTGFEFGKFALLDVLDAQRSLLHARSQYLLALADMHRAAADIGRLAGADQPSLQD